MSFVFRPIPRWFVLLLAMSFAVGRGDTADAAQREMELFPTAFAAAAVTKAEVAPANRTDDSEEASEARKRRIVQNALLLIGGIALLGVMLIVVVVLGAIRLRRRNRKRMGKSSQTAFDPLWYLRAGAKTPKADRRSTTTESDLDSDDTP